MGAIDKFLDFMRIGDDADYPGDEEDFESAVEKKPAILGRDESDPEERMAKKPAVNKISQIPRTPKRGQTSGMEVVRLKPESVEDGRKISDLLSENKVVFLDLEGIDMNLAQRIVDFTSGATYAIDGTLQRMSRYTFVIAPPVVAVSGDFQEALIGGDSSVTF
ncbi:MAG: cell division protein SepF [Lachnospiraceae bacterium]|nr:cell division protein SepF [Lachnospiraceae bacterium]